MRTRSPAFRTLPSRTVLTPSASPISLTFVFFPLKENADVRAATFRLSIFVRAFNNSSANPSQKNSFSGSELMLTNGSTAIEFAALENIFVRPLPLSTNPEMPPEGGTPSLGNIAVASSAETPGPSSSALPSSRQKFNVSSA